MGSAGIWDLSLATRVWSGNTHSTSPNHVEFHFSIPHHDINDGILTRPPMSSRASTAGAAVAPLKHVVMRSIPV